MILVNGIELTPTIFPDQTCQVWKLDEKILKENLVQIEWHYSSDAEMMQIAQLKKLLDHHEVDSSLHMPYLPYARQDKSVSNSTTFGLEVFAEWINWLHFHNISCLDAHSEMPTQLIERFTSFPPTVEIEKAFKISGANILCFPDHGAAAKYGQIGLTSSAAIIGHKTRDPLTGNITDFSINGNPSGTKVLIVDDIIDGGLTFVTLAELLFRGGAESVSVYATHGIFSKGVDILYKAGIDAIFTKDGLIFPSRHHQMHTIKKWGDL